ncbi:MAG TPA: D-aminoacyl-tRNA deacylase [Pyrinomonadaceae bacterium]|nr:D-aminoacyl-tRNA deacylase [Pyrinomonadaceae bacterium]
MRAVLQRVSRAKVTVDGRVTGEIDRGLLILLGVGHSDDETVADKLLDKITKLRIFENSEGKMNLSLAEIEGEMLVVSQFTLYADTRKGRRPSFIEAASPVEGNRLYEYFVLKARETVRKVDTGEFGAMMDVELVNDGPVTITIDTDN